MVGPDGEASFNARFGRTICFGHVVACFEGAARQGAPNLRGGAATADAPLDNLTRGLAEGHGQVCQAMSAMPTRSVGSYTCDRVALGVEVRDGHNGERVVKLPSPS